VGNEVKAIYQTRNTGVWLLAKHGIFRLLLNKVPIEQPPDLFPEK
jgi:hypothetical protein